MSCGTPRGQRRDERVDITEVQDAEGRRDVGRTITALKKRYPGQMDFGRASGMVKQMLR